LKEQLNSIVSHSLSRASFFQLNFFVLGREPTIQARIHRCVEELKSRKNSLDMAELQIEEFKDRIQLLNIKKQKISKKIKDQGELDIYLRQLDRKIKQTVKEIEDMENKIKTTEEEASFFINAFEELTKREAIKPWDDYQVQLEYWNEKYSREIKERILLQLPIDIEIIKSVLSLPEETEVKKQTLLLLEKQHKKLLEG